MTKHEIYQHFSAMLIKVFPFSLQVHQSSAWVILMNLMTHSWNLQFAAFLYLLWNGKSWTLVCRTLEKWQWHETTHIMHMTMCSLRCQSYVKKSYILRLMAIMATLYHGRKKLKRVVSHIFIYRLSISKYFFDFLLFIFIVPWSQKLLRETLLF